MSYKTYAEMYPNVIRRVPMTDEQYERYHRKMRMVEILKGRIPEIVASLLEEATTREDELWDAIRLEIDDPEKRNNAIIADWAGREFIIRSSESGNAEDDS